MQPNVTFKQIKSSEGVSDYATKKLQKIDKYKDFKFLDAKYTFSTEKENSVHVAELALQIKNKNLVAVAEATTMYKAIDEVVAKICRQLEKQKSCFKQKRHEDSMKDQELDPVREDDDIDMYD
jgi:ribosomal subunit interface protein